jgi:vancomycin resistance protein YoaR
VKEQNLKRTHNSIKLNILLRLLAILSGGVGLFLIITIFLLLRFTSSHANQIYPGVSVAGVDPSGMEPQQAIEKLRELITYPNKGKIVFQYGEKLWVANPEQIGLSLDPEHTALAAYAVGRQGNIFKKLSDQFKTWQNGVILAPIMVYDQSKAYVFLEEIAQEINQPAIEATIAVQDNSLISIAGQIGRSVDIPTTLSTLEPYLSNMTDALIPLVVHETVPQIIDTTATAAAANAILNQSLVLRVPDQQENEPLPWLLDRQTLLGMISIQRIESEQGSHFEVGLDQKSLRNYLENIAKKFDSHTENARFIFNDETRQLELIQPARIGRALNIETTLQEINQHIAQGIYTVDLQMETYQPQVTNDANAQDFGITELVSSHTSYFYGSSAERIQNIQTASARFHGVMVPPGATFSMAEVLGDVSLDTGYAEALIIFGNRTIEGVGGGVCQVSTTLFRTAFLGGFPIVERHPHAYRVTYYEQTRSGGIDTNLAGLDATVFVPVVDFKFTNDTPYWLLMETYVNAAARTLTWKFYSTSDGRTVEWKTSGLHDIVEPDNPIFQENPELAKNEIKQVDWEVDGADVTVERTVYRNGEIYLQDTFYTHYIPWQAIYEYGPGSDLTKLLKKLGLKLVEP